METIFQYDNSKEEQLNALICNLDDAPILNIRKSRIEEVVYLKFNYFKDTLDFQEKAQLKFDEFISYVRYLTLKDFGDTEYKIELASTLSCLLIKYQDAQKQFINSALRKEWRKRSRTLEIPDNNDSYIYKAEETSYRNAYDFFYKMSSLQLEYIEKIISSLSSQLQPFNKYIKVKTQAETASIKEEKKEKEEIYYFRIRQEFTTTSRIILPMLHEQLKNADYIDCTLPAFKKLFIKYNEKIPDSTPPAIIWKGQQHNHFAYFIQYLYDTFLTSQDFSSFNEVSVNLFYRVEVNEFFPAKKRLNRVGQKAKEKIDSIMKKSNLNKKQTTDR